MLKIKDDVNLGKIKEKGFIAYKGEWIKQISCNAGISIDLDGVISIFRNSNCDCVVDQLDLLYDLIKDGLVEKVDN